MCKKIFICLALILMPCCSLAASRKNETVYKVEMIVFTRLTAQAFHSESWGTPLESKDLLSIKPSSIEDLNRVNYTPLSKDQFDLNLLEKRIRINTKYKVIEHVAWLQSISRYKDLAAPVSITPTDWYDLSGKQLDSDKIPNTQNKVPEVTGSTTIGLNRYFNVRLNFMLNVPKNLIKSIAKDNATSKLPGNFYQFHIDEVRRIRSGELNYFDHPLFGVIFEISKIKS